MTVSALSSSLSATSTTTGTPQNQLKGTQDEFLKMFMAQLQNQDPMNPQQGADMVAQLATFSQVEQSTQTNTELTALTAQETSNASSGMANLVGRNAQATAGDFTLTASGGAPPALSVTATSPMSGATAQITDANGKVVRTIPIPDGTSATVQWDGKDASGAAVPPGSYHIAVDGGKTAAATTAQWQGTIGAVELTDSGARLRMGDILIAPSDIRTIGTSAAALSTIPPSTATTALSTQGALQ